MFVEFKKPLVREDVVVNTELITSIEKSEELNFPPDSPTVQTNVLAEVGFRNGMDTGNVVTGETKYIPSSTEKLGTFYITLYMRDPLYNLSENNRTFNNAVTLTFSDESERDDIYKSLKNKIQTDEVK